MQAGDPKRRRFVDSWRERMIVPTIGFTIQVRAAVLLSIFAITIGLAPIRHKIGDTIRQITKVTNRNSGNGPHISRRVPATNSRGFAGFRVENYYGAEGRRVAFSDQRLI